MSSAWWSPAPNNTKDELINNWNCHEKMDKSKILINLKSQKVSYEKVILFISISSSNHIVWASAKHRASDRGSIFKVFAVYLTSYGNSEKKIIIDGIPQCNGVYFSVRCQCSFSKMPFIFILQVYTTWICSWGNLTLPIDITWLLIMNRPLWVNAATENVLWCLSNTAGD